MCVLHYNQMNSVTRDTVSGLTLCIGSADEFCRATYALQCALQPRFAVRLVRAKNMSSAKALFSEFAAALQFPCYFGNNWNAFDECIADLEWLPAEGYVVLIVDGASVLQTDSADREVLFKIMASVAQEWASVRELPFQTFIHCLDEEAEVIRCSIATRSETISVGELTPTLAARHVPPRTESDDAYPSARRLTLSIRSQSY